MGDYLFAAGFLLSSFKWEVSGGLFFFFFFLLPRLFLQKHLVFFPLVLGGPGVDFSTIVRGFFDCDILRGVVLGRYYILRVC